MSDFKLFRMDHAKISEEKLFMMQLLLSFQFAFNTFHLRHVIL